MPLGKPFCLSPPHRFSNSFGNLLLLCSANLVQVKSLQYELLQHLPHEILVHVVGVEIG